MSFIAAGGAIVGAGVSIYSGIKQREAAKKQLAANQFQPATVPQAALDNQQLARQQANAGLPAQQYDLAMKNIQRSRVAALRAASDRRAGVGLIGQIQSNTDDATAGLDATNAQARINNTKQLIGVNSQVAGYQQNAWNQNNSNRQQQYDYGMSLLGAGDANIIGGIDTGVAGLMRYGSMRRNPYGTSSATPSVRYASPGLPDVARNNTNPNVYAPSLTGY